jgi:hypothetical protein
MKDVDKILIFLIILTIIVIISFYLIATNIKPIEMYNMTWVEYFFMRG